MEERIKNNEMVNVIKFKQINYLKISCNLGFKSFKRIIRHYKG